MFQGLKRRVHRFMAEPSGSRFRAYHERLEKHQSLMRTLLVVGVGLVLLALGLIMLVLPGPGLLVGTFGAVLLAGESLVVARILDRLDLWLTGLWKRWRR